MKTVIKAAIIGAVALGMSATTSFAGNKKGHSPKPTICFTAKPHYSSGHSNAHRPSYGNSYKPSSRHDHRSSRGDSRASSRGKSHGPSHSNNRGPSQGNGHRR